MSITLTFPSDELIPDQAAVLENQGIPASTVVPDRIEKLLAAALDLFSKCAAPVGLLAEISKPEFQAVYHGQGRNEPATPVGDIFPRADHLALFAITLGEGISQEIKERFAANDFALGSMLDAVASAAADKAAELATGRFAELLTDKKLSRDCGTGVSPVSPHSCGTGVSPVSPHSCGTGVSPVSPPPGRRCHKDPEIVSNGEGSLPPDATIPPTSSFILHPSSFALNYSPGYCGWHISGQKKLFKFLHPEQIGISLTDTCLMQPLKSVSGVIMAGPREIHDFQDAYPFCPQCDTHGCRKRWRAMAGE